MVDAAKARMAGAQEADLQSPEPQLRWRAAASLGRVRTVGAVQALGRALSDPEPFVRWAAAQSLGEIARQATNSAVRVVAGKVVLDAAAAPDRGTRAAAADAVAAWKQAAPLPRACPY
ncbi:MAG: HEAT repeat domain-containing protein, partial [Anaerolineae bacterium]|nr:HEAT repeat domain-containing protein [Anaerolineae bacterium]